MSNCQHGVNLKHERCEHCEDIAAAEHRARYTTLPNASPAKLRLVEHELKATKEALETVMIERDALQARLEAVHRENVELAASLELAIRQIQDASSELLRAADAGGQE